MKPIERSARKSVFFWSALVVAAAGLYFLWPRPPLSNVPTGPPAAQPSRVEQKSEAPAPPKGALPVRGAAAAPVTIEEFSDFQCPYCARSVTNVKQILEKYPGEVRWIFRHFPVFSSHPTAPAIHLVAIAAGEQGRFWEMHDLLFANQDRVSRDDLFGYARQLHLDMKLFEETLRDRDLLVRIETDYNEAVDRGVRATPTFFINGRKVEGAIPLPLFEREVESALARAKGAAAPTAPSGG
ncbi:MAG: DsbA family protein [Nitrospirae bacterium]|nr:DsbA family protein [Candidatus Manganitrophaceae bacterium]